jgi:hypothetical protein
MGALLRPALNNYSIAGVVNSRGLEALSIACFFSSSSSSSLFSSFFLKSNCGSVGLLKKAVLIYNSVSDTRLTVVE